MKSTLPFACFAVSCFLTINKVSANNRWELELDKEGIRVYTQLDENSPYKQIKVIYDHQCAFRTSHGYFA